ncbi:MAG: hypothetical protein M1837_000880 [Sclerophora amabilis]|nr:MAG: hypothetical protein M1837_000880 [Sclerophora amabilis]
MPKRPLRTKSQKILAPRGPLLQTHPHGTFLSMSVDIPMKPDQEVPPSITDPGDPALEPLDIKSWTDRSWGRFAEQDQEILKRLSQEQGVWRKLHTNGQRPEKGQSWVDVNMGNKDKKRQPLAQPQATAHSKSDARVLEAVHKKCDIQLEQLTATNNLLHSRISQMHLVDAFGSCPPNGGKKEGSAPSTQLVGTVGKTMTAQQETQSAGEAPPDCPAASNKAKNRKRRRGKKKAEGQVESEDVGSSTKIPASAPENGLTNTSPPAASSTRGLRKTMKTFDQFCDKLIEEMGEHNTVIRDSGQELPASKKTLEDLQIPSEWPGRVKQALQDYQFCLVDLEMQRATLVTSQFEVHGAILRAMRTSDKEWERARTNAMSVPQMLEYERARRDTLAMDVVCNRAQDKMIDFIEEAGDDAGERIIEFVDRVAAESGWPELSYNTLKSTCPPVTEILEEAHDYRNGDKEEWSKALEEKYKEHHFWETFLHHKQGRILKLPFNNLIFDSPRGCIRILAWH